MPTISIRRAVQHMRDAIERRPELLLAGAFAIVAVVASATLKLASEITEGETLAADRAILKWLREVIANSPSEAAIRQVMLDITTLGGATTLTLIVVLSCGLLLSLKRYGTAALLAIQVIAGTGLVSLAKIFFARARPDVVPYFTQVSSASYPSGHAANSAIVYLSLAVLLATTAPTRPARIYILAVAMILTVAIGFSRLVLGVHWPSDVIAGWSIGAGWALSVGLLGRWLQRHGVTR